MAVEYVVREPFSLPGAPRVYQVGEHIADAETMAKVEEHHSMHVRRINRADAPVSDTSVLTPPVQE